MKKRVFWLIVIMLLVVSVITHVVEECSKVEVLALELELENVARKTKQWEDMLQEESEEIEESLELIEEEAALVIEERVEETVEEVESIVVQKVGVISEEVELVEEENEVPIMVEKVESITQERVEPITQEIELDVEEMEPMVGEELEPIVVGKMEQILEEEESTVIKEQEVLVEELSNKAQEQDVDKEIKIVEEINEVNEGKDEGEYLPTAIITSYGNEVEEANMLRLINEERNKLGLQPLSYDVRLYSAAKIRCVEITQVFSHTRPDGSNCFSVSTVVHGENLSYSNSHDTQVAYQQFYNSSSHKANMLEPEFTKFACNRVVSDGLVYWVQVFGYN